MKHIKKEFLNQLTKEEFETLQTKYKFEQYSVGDTSKNPNAIKPTENTVAILQTTKDIYFTGFPHKIKGTMYVFPEPDPTLIYFSSAQKFRRQIPTTKDKLLNNTNISSNVVDDNIVEDFYSYYEAVCGTVLFLFLSLESFANSFIPHDFVYKRELKNKTETYNCYQIQENINFYDKLKDVLPQISSYNYFEKHPLKAQIITQLKEFRDSIVHTKKENKAIQHDFIVKRSFSFDFDSAIDNVADFMNSYRPNYIKECNCGKEF